MSEPLSQTPAFVMVPVGMPDKPSRALVAPGSKSFSTLKKEKFVEVLAQMLIYLEERPVGMVHPTDTDLPGTTRLGTTFCPSMVRDVMTGKLAVVNALVAYGCLGKTTL